MSSWISSTACKAPSTSTLPAFEQTQEWLAYLLFAQCPQHFLASTIDLIFLSSIAIRHIAYVKQARRHPAPQLAKPSNLSAGFFATLSLSTYGSIISIALLAFSIWDCLQYYGRSAHTTRELVFLCLEAIAWLSSTALVLNERKQLSLKHGYTLRMWWSFMGLSSCFELLSSVFRLAEASGFHYDVFLIAEDMYAIVKFPVAAYFMYKSVYSLTGVRVPVGASPEQNGVESPFLSKQANYGSSSTSGFAVASFYSKLTISWLTPVLLAGSKHSLEAKDVPELAPGDDAQSMLNLFEKNWPQNRDCTNPLTLTVLKSFWPQMIYTGLLQILKSIVVFGGPLMIPSFTSYAQGVYVTPYDGYVLVLLLLLSKMAELVSYHQFNFLSYKLGNNIRTAVVAMLYKKALRLSSSSRQEHGVAQITNYMIVDAQQISDACLQLHLIWAVPLQIAIAVVILYIVLGLSSVAGLVALILIALLTSYISARQKYYQLLLVKGRDTRMQAIIETLAYIKVIKLQAWDEKFKKRVEGLRQEEFKWLTKFVYAAACNSGILWNAQPLVSVATYLVAVLIGTPLSTSIIFTAASVFRVVQGPIRNFPQSLVALTQVMISFQRLNKFMQSTELQEGAISKHYAVDDFPVAVEVGSFAWNEIDARPILTHINLKIKKGYLCTIAGTVGSGKSSLLCALLGEMFKLSGKAKTSGSIAYVAQNAWIQNATIEDNILFGSSKDDLRYNQVLHACALIHDLESMDYGDRTEIGEKGINLSGGQKQRIQLARAVYQNKDVYLLDDVFSAVDAHTGSHIFKECILGMLSGKTILLVTHQVEFLAGADLVLVMKDGRISQAGKYEEILTRGSDFEALVTAHNQAMESVQNDGMGTDFSIRRVEEISEPVSLKRVRSMERSVDEQILGSFDGSMETFPSAFLTDFKAEGTSKLIAAEQREIGRVNLKVYIVYLTKAFGWSALILLLLNEAIWQALLLSANFWISKEIPEDTDQSYNSTKFITVYIILNAGAWLAVVIRVVILAIIGLKTSQLFFIQMLQSIIRAPMSFFDTTPSGRIISRFSSDQTNLDFLLHFYVGGLLGTLINGVGCIIVICISAWPIVIFIIPLAGLYSWYQLKVGAIVYC
ncbi:hypothetical protein L7F22_064649 [Adiantum nelumboides]|nr:hypothetical protein [Adiantum nelumboides]